MGTSDFYSMWFFSISFISYLVATISYILYAVFKKELIGKIATWILVVGVLGNTIALVLRTQEARHAPFVTTYETLTFWSWLIALVYLFLQFRFRIRVLGALVTPLAFLAIAAASLLPEQYVNKQPTPLMPALQSHWLEFHIVTCFIGYACFAVSFAVSIAYLVKRTNNAKAMLSKDRLDMIGYKSISLGFPFLTLGIISGAIWANAAWSRYWGWDPKEVWSLVTWLIYAIYLHLRIVAKWKGSSAAITSIVGFVAVMFTFFGVNYVLPHILPEPGLHSYV